MTEKTRPEAPEETDPVQSERFRKAVAELEAAGDLNLTEADSAFATATKRVLPSRSGQRCDTRSRSR